LDIHPNVRTFVPTKMMNMNHYILADNQDLTRYAIEELIRHAFSIVFKDCPLKDIRDALQSASHGQRYISQRAMEQLLTKQHEEEKTGVLTATEMEIVKAIAQGKTTKEIAEERFSSIHTITTHRKNIFRKLDVNTAHEAIKYALRAGWVNPSEFYI